MDLSLVAYSLTAFAALMVFSAVTVVGTWETHAQSLPPFLTDQGYTPQVFVNQVTDSFNRIRKELATHTHTNVVVGGTLTPASEIASAFGLGAALRATKETFGVSPPRIEIEIVERDGVAHWRLRGEHAVRGFLVQRGERPLTDTDGLIDEIAYNTVGFVSPFEAIAYDLVHESWSEGSEETVDRASDLLAECDTSTHWSEHEQHEEHGLWAFATSWRSPSSWSRDSGCSPANIRLGLVLRGLAYLEAGRHDQALHDLENANEMGEADPIALAFLGDVHAAAGDMATAEHVYGQAATLSPHVAHAFHEFAHGLASAGNHHRAIKRFATASRLGATDTVFLVDWGDSLHVVGEHEAALEKFFEADARETAINAYRVRIEKTQAAIAAEATADAKAPKQMIAPGTRAD